MGRIAEGDEFGRSGAGFGGASFLTVYRILWVSDGGWLGLGFCWTRPGDKAGQPHLEVLPQTQLKGDEAFHALQGCAPSHRKSYP